ncbi:MAG: agglutinin biogenesis protein MshI [Burkholderiales bacterium]
MLGMKWPFKRQTREPGWLAVSLQPGELSFVHGHYVVGGSASVDVCGTQVFEGGFEGAQQAARERDLGRYQCSTLLAPGEYQVLLVEAPNVPQAELKTAIRWRIKDLLDYHVNDATVDVLAVPPNPAGSERAQSMYAVTARNDLIQSCIGRFESARIPLSVIDIQETSQRNIAALFERDDRGLAMLYMGQSEGLLTINFRRELMLARRIDVGMQNITLVSGAAREEQLQRVLLELQRTFDHFDRQYAYVPVSKLMLAPDSEETGLAEFLARNLDMPVERARLSAAIDFGARAELEPQEEWRFFHLIGAALRQESKAL